MPAGRPTAYREEYCEQAYKLTLLMATDREIADFFGVVEDTINEWKEVHPAFSVSIKRGKMMADAEVGEKLKHRAMGYSHDAVKIFMPAGASEPVYAPYTEHYPPDTQAASLWLRNRQPTKWRDKQEHELSGSANLGVAEAVFAGIAGIFGLPPPVVSADDVGGGGPVVSGPAKRGRKARP